jgi:hypothetical protein
MLLSPLVSINTLNFHFFWDCAQHKAQRVGQQMQPSLAPESTTYSPSSTRLHTRTPAYQYIASVVLSKVRSAGEALMYARMIEGNMGACIL